MTYATAGPAVRLAGRSTRRAAAGERPGSAGAPSSPYGEDRAEEPLPLLQARLGMWFASAAVDPDGSTFSVGDCISFDSPVDPDLLEAAHHLLSREIEGSRSFEDTGERPVEVSGTDRGWPPHRVDCRAFPDPAAAALRWIDDDMRSSADPQARPLFQAALSWGNLAAYLAIGVALCQGTCVELRWPA